MFVSSLTHPEDQQIYSRLNTRGYELHRHQQGQFVPGQPPPRQPPPSDPQPYYHQPQQQYAGQPSNYEPVYSQLDPRMLPAARDSTMRGAESPQDRAPPMRARGPEQNPQLPQQMFVGYPNQFQGPPQRRPVALPPQPPPPPKEEKKVGWVCVGCTFINKPRRPGCEQCGTARPEDYKIPDNCPLDDDELRILQQQEENEKLFQEVCM